jgi:hypothetical protein
MDPIEILKSVNDFYQQAWDKLIIYTGILVAVVGIIIPILFNWLQNRTQRIREESIKNEIESNLNLWIKGLEEKFNKKYEETVSKMSSELLDKVNIKAELAEAYSFHIQGNSSFATKDFYTALYSYFSAATRFLTGNEYSNLLRINDNILKSLEFSNEEVLNRLDETGNGIEKYLSFLREHDEKNLFYDFIDNVRLIVKKIKASDKNKSNQKV